MTKEITSGVRLTLQDLFSPGMRKAGNEVKTFSGTAVTALQKADGMLSGMTAKFSALAGGLSLGAASKEIIDLDDRLSGLGVQAGVSGKKVNQLKNEIYEAAQSPDIKLDTTSVVDALDAVIERTGDMKFAEANIKSMAQAIRATGASGADIGGLYAEFQKMGLGAEDAAVALDTLTIQGKEGAFTLQDLAGLGPRTINAYTATGRTGVQALREMGAALQVIRMGTGSSEQAATAFEATMRSLTDVDKQQKLRQIGVSVRDTKGDFRSVVDIMNDIIVKSKGNTDILGQIFDGESIRAFNFAISEYNKEIKEGKNPEIVASLKKFNDMLGDGKTVEKDAAERAKTLKANIQSLTTAFVKFADTNLAGPFKSLADIMNSMADNSEKYQKMFGIIAAGAGSIVAIKGMAGIASTLQTINGFFSQKAPVPGRTGMNKGTLSGAGAAGAIPVYVTNWNGGKNGISTGGLSGKGSGAGYMTLSQIESYNSQVVKSAGMQAVVLQTIATAGYQAVDAFMKFQEINADENLTKKQKSTAKGGAAGKAIGTTVGTIAGGAGGVALGAFAAGKIGAIIGTAIAPGIGTAIGYGLGAAGGALGGWLLGKAGEKAGSAIGAAVGSGAERKELEKQRLTLPLSQDMAAAQRGADFAAAAKITGNAQLSIGLKIEEDRVRAKTSVANNGISFLNINTGSTEVARSMQ